MDFMEGTGGPWWIWLGLNCLQCFGLACGRCFGKLGSDNSIVSLTLSEQHCLHGAPMMWQEQAEQRREPGGGVGLQQEGGSTSVQHTIDIYNWDAD
jgi:hypothetical protein